MAIFNGFVYGAVEDDSSTVGEVYSDRETEIGIWMGKPLFRKVVISTITQLDAEVKLGTIASTAKIVNMYGVADTGGAYTAIPTYILAVYSYSGGIYVFANSGGNISAGNTVNVTVEYTKN